MVQTDIKRPLTEDERKYIRPLLKKSAFDGFKEKLAVHDQTVKKLYKPICVTCAINDYDLKRKRIIEEYKMRGKAMSEDKAAEIIGEVDFDQYTGIDKFELLDESEAREPTLIGTTKVNQLVGYNRNYQCKKRQHGMTVFVPMGEWDRQQKYVETADKPMTASKPEEKPTEVNKETPEVTDFKPTLNPD